MSDIGFRVYTHIRARALPILIQNSLRPPRTTIHTMFKVFKAVAHAYLYMHDEWREGRKLFELPVHATFCYGTHELLNVSTPVKRNPSSMKAFEEDLENVATIADVVAGPGVYDLYITTDPKTYMFTKMEEPKIWQKWYVALSGSKNEEPGAWERAVHEEFCMDMQERAEYVGYYLNRAYPGAVMRVFMNGTQII